LKPPAPSSPKKYRCLECNRSFQAKCNLQSHISQKHKKQRIGSQTLLPITKPFRFGKAKMRTTFTPIQEAEESRRLERLAKLKEAEAESKSEDVEVKEKTSDEKKLDHNNEAVEVSKDENVGKKETTNVRQERELKIKGTRNSYANDEKIRWYGLVLKERKENPQISINALAERITEEFPRVPFNTARKFVKLEEHKIRDLLTLSFSSRNRKMKRASSSWLEKNRQPRDPKTAAILAATFKKQREERKPCNWKWMRATYRKSYEEAHGKPK
jgi:hypothetical protein